MKTKKSPVRPLALAAIASSVLAITSYSAFASLSAQAQNLNPESVNAGNVSLTLADNGFGFSQSISNMVPGDVVNRHITLNNNGSLDGKNLTLSVATSGTQTLITDGASTKALRLTIKSCSVAWTAATGTCSGTQTTLLNNSSFSALASASALESAAFNSGASKHLQISIALPEQTEVTVNGVAPVETIQGGTASLTYTFGIQQRVATTTNN